MRGNQVQERIVEESIRLFLRKSYKGVAVSDITDSVNVSKAAFYYYFKSKAQLLEAIIDKFDHGFVDNIIETIENVDGSFLSKFKLSHKLTTEFGYANRELILAFLTLSAELAGSGDPLERKTSDVYKKFVDFYVRLIDLGKQEGVIDENTDSVLLANIIVGNHNGVLIGWHVNSDKDKFDSKKAAKMYLNVLLFGMLKEKAQ